MTAIDYDGLVEQLNGVANYFQEVGCSSTIPAEAATAIQTLRAEVERTKYDGIHTCHDQCQRTACVLRRELADRDARLAEAVGMMTRAVGDIAAALINLGREGDIPEWTKDYVAAINAYESKQEPSQ